MLIKYLGPKPEKKLQYHHKDWGNMTYVFNPVCEVNDTEFAKFLLHPDRKGLFETVEANELVKDSKPNAPKKTEKSYVAPTSVESKKEEVAGQAGDADLGQAVGATQSESAPAAPKPKAEKKKAAPKKAKAVNGAVAS